MDQHFRMLPSCRYLPRISYEDMYSNISENDYFDFGNNDYEAGPFFSQYLTGK